MDGNSVQTRLGFEVFTVSQVTRRIKGRLSADPFLQDLWIRGEIGKFTHHHSGHMYFTLKDEDSQIPCVFFKGANKKMKFELREGMSILAQGFIDLYAPQGKYQLNIQSAEPKGVGTLYLAYIQLKEKLEKEGLFDDLHKKELPTMPVIIGVVTSPTGAALRDILNVLARRFPMARVILAPARVQGDSAAFEIAKAIGHLNRHDQAEIIIVGRGGGSLEDLWAFNEEEVARAIFNSRIPIMSAVGHQIDHTISDLVADVRAPTPSAAAELVVPDSIDLRMQLAASTDRLSSELEATLSMHKEQLERLKGTLKPRTLLDLVNKRRQDLDSSLWRLQGGMTRLMDSSKGEFDILAEKMASLNPLATMGRGYAHVWNQTRSTAISLVEDVGAGDEVRINIRDGHIDAVVSSSTKNKRRKKRNDE